MQTSYRKVKQYNNIGDVDHGAQALTYRFIIFALDQVPLLNYYKRLGFLSLQKQDEQFVYQTCKPSYDVTCIFMYKLL